MSKTPKSEKESKSKTTKSGAFYALSPSARLELKSPLGLLFRDLSELKGMLIPGKRIITVGDVCTISFLKAKIHPHLAIFDYLSKREPISDSDETLLKKSFPKRKKYVNPSGQISKKLLEDAPELLSKGGAIEVSGEEDLTALIFLLVGEETDLILYGQPNLGLVVVKPTKPIKEKIKKWFGG